MTDEQYFWWNFGVIVIGAICGLGWLIREARREGRSRARSLAREALRVAARQERIGRFYGGEE